MQPLAGGGEAWGGHPLACFLPSLRYRTTAGLNFSHHPPHGSAPSYLSPAVSLAASEGDDRLPRASTCFNTLFLPRYSSAAVLEARLLQAVSGGHAFDEGELAEGGWCQPPTTSAHMPWSHMPLPCGAMG